MKGECWYYLMQHIQSSPYTDCIFLARTGSRACAERFTHSISRIRYLIVNRVHLYPPTSNVLAERMGEAASVSIDDALGLASLLFEELRPAS